MIRTRLEHYIGGRWVPVSGPTLEVIDPSTEETIASTPVGDETVVDAAVLAAAAAQASWWRTDARYRASVLREIADGMVARRDELAATITSEVGVPIRSSGPVQVDLAVGILRYYADLAETFEFVGELGSSRVIHRPLGVVAAITPWNYPLYQIASKLGPALASGCTVVLKPSEVAPLNTVVLAEIIDAASAPVGVVNVVFGTGEAAGEPLARHPRVDMVSFTGSTRAGRRVSELAAQTVKPVSLELGGKSACVVLRGADLEAAVRDTLGKCYANSGQNCGALSRLIVPREDLSTAGEMASKFSGEYRVGDPRDPETRLGPLVSAVQLERVAALIQTGIDEGATLVRGEHPTMVMRRGYFVEPHVFTGVNPRSTIAQQEIFGPVLSIIAYQDEQEAIEIANGTPYGLCGAVWGPDVEAAIAIAPSIRAGQVDVNGAAYNPMAPFGGFGASGHGRELGPFGIHDFVATQAIQLPA